MDLLLVVEALCMGTPSIGSRQIGQQFGWRETFLPLVKKVSKAIADRRKAVSITQEERATTLDVGIEAISRMERGVKTAT